jgi:molybdopterin biosynthesis enzyme
MSDSRPVLMLPGRIDTAIAGFRRASAIDRLSGSHEAQAGQIARHAQGRLTHRARGDRPVRLQGAEPIASGYWPLAPLAGTDGWILVPANSEGFPAGSEVVIRPGHERSLQKVPQVTTLSR